MLSLAKCHLTDTSVIEISNHITTIEELDLFGCNQITSNTLKQLFKQCQKLTALDISECSLLTDAAFMVTLPNLHTINLMRNYPLTDRTVYQLCKFCTDLRFASATCIITRSRSINIRSCAAITESSISTLIRTCRKLTSINVKEVVISAQLLNMIKKVHPHLRLHE